MSRLITNAIRSTSASADAITFDGSGNATFPANATCSGTATGFGGGKILQVVQTYYTTIFSSTSTSYVDVGLSATITPSSTSNKILILTQLSVGCSSTNSVSFRLYNGSSEITAATNANVTNGGALIAAINHPSGAQYDIDQIPNNFLYTSNTTSATTIKVYGKTDDGTFYINRYGYSTSVGGGSSITLMEVGA